MPLFTFPRILPALTVSFAVGVSVSTAVLADGFAGPYLAARQAGIENDFSASVAYGSRALIRDPSNGELMQGVLIAQIGLGKFQQAVPVARRLQELRADNQISGLVLLVDAIQSEDWADVLSRLENGSSIGGVLDLVIRAWALVGDGRVAEAMDVFTTLHSDEDPAQFATYHQALARAFTGDFEGAATIFSGEGDIVLRLDRSGVIAYIQVLSQLERNPDAIDLIDAAFPAGGGEEIEILRRELLAGKPIAFSAISSPRDGLADVFVSLAQSLARELDPTIVLIYSRTAEYLKPDLYAATLLSASMFETLELYDLAVPQYQKIPVDDPLYLGASLARADALRRWGRPEDAIEVLEGLARSHPDSADVHKTLADSFRFLNRCEEALPSYDKAVALFDELTNRQWPLFFSRAICLAQIDDWPAAEADFRKALELNPEQPSVLNYLGYSLVEKHLNLDEALDMIERAVAARPGDGAITDSLGWVYYRLGRYPEAVEQMERAIELLPIDPVVNDHLGDVYWAVGRRLEAKFQWSRALSFITDETDVNEVKPDRIRRKLEVGLDAVLQEEGADPLIRSNEGG